MINAGESGSTIRFMIPIMLTCPDEIEFIDGKQTISSVKSPAYYLQQSGFRLIAATEKTDNLIYDVDMTGPCAIIMGSEGKGISQAMLDLADDKAAIPMAGEITSLNVSVASAVLMYEAVRQRLGK